jgi:predicted nucleotidyltransferase component of viral defense system
MPRDYLQNHPEFSDLIRIVAEEKGIDPALVEKDHWIMHCLYGLQKLDFIFQLKGGTSLSKGHGIISRFSEDIDILIEPPPERGVKTGRNQNKTAHIKTRKPRTTVVGHVIQCRIALDHRNAINPGRRDRSRRLHASLLRHP